MEPKEDVSASSLGSINLDAKPKKSILKRSEPEAEESTADGAEGDAADTGKHHVPFSRIIPELSRLEEEDARLGTVIAGPEVSDLQSVSSAASLSPLSSDEELDGTVKARPDGPPHLGPVPSLRSNGDPDQQPGGTKRRTRTRTRPRTSSYCRLDPPQVLPDMEPVSPPRDHFPPGPLRSLSPPLRPVEHRSPSPRRLVRYSPSPERLVRGRHSRSPLRRSPLRRSPLRRSPMRRSPLRRSHSRRSRSRSPRRRSRSPGRYRRGPSPRYGRRGWSRSPSPRRHRSRSRSRSPPWGKGVEHSLLALSRSKRGVPAGYGPATPGMPGYPPGVPGYPTPPPGPRPFMVQPMPYANPPMPAQMVPGTNPPFGQPAIVPPGAPVYPLQIQPQTQPPPPGTVSPAGVSVPVAGTAGVSEHIDSETFLREVERRKLQKNLVGSQPAHRQLTDVQQLQRSNLSASPTPAPSQTPTPSPSDASTPKVEKLPSEATESEELQEIRKKKPWMTQQLLDLRAEMERNRTQKNVANFKVLARQWNELVLVAKQRLEAKQKLGLADSPGAHQVLEGGQVVPLSASTVARLKARQVEYIELRDRMAGKLHQLKLEQKALDGGSLVMKKGKPKSNKELNENLKEQGALLKSLETVTSVLAQLKQMLDPNVVMPEGSVNGVGAVLLKEAQGEADGAGGSASKSEVAYLLLGDETLSAVQVYVREQEARAAFGTDLAAERIRLVSRPDASFSSVEFRHWVRAAVRQSSAETLVLLAGAGCLAADTSWSAPAAVAPLLPLLRDLRADGLTRVVVVGVPVKPDAGKKDRAAQFNRALQQTLESAGPHVPRVVYMPVRGGPQDGFGEQTEGGLTLDLYNTLQHVIRKCEQKPQRTLPGLPEPQDGSAERRELDSAAEAASTLQGLLDGLKGRLAGDEAAGLGAVAALLARMKDQGEVAEPQQEEQEDPSAEDPGVFFRDPADHICLHCKKIFLSAKGYLEHLKSPEHTKQYLTVQQNIPESPWRKEIPPIEKKTKNAESRPIKGLDMFMHVDCWYCKVCEMFVGDLRCASSHLKSRRHNAKYDDYLENNPSYHAVVSETRSKLLLECAEQEEQRTRQRRREEAQKRGDRMNEKMRRQSESSVQDVTDEAGAAAGAAVTPPAAAAKKAGIKLNLLVSPTQAPDEMGKLKRKVQANIAAEQQAKRLKEDATEKEAKEAANGEEKKAKEVAETAVKEEDVKVKTEEALVPTVSNQPGASAAAKVKITLSDKAPQKPATGAAAAKKKVMPMVGKLPKLRPKKPEPAKPERQPSSELSKSELATLELANRQEVLASIPTPAAPPPAGPLTEAISDDEGPPGDAAADMQDLLDIDLPDADERDADELKMLGICDQDVAAQQLPATRPPP